jgi:hypothetical protein
MLLVKVCGCPETPMTQLGLSFFTASSKVLTSPPPSRLCANGFLWCGRVAMSRRSVTRPRESTSQMLAHASDMDTPSSMTMASAMRDAMPQPASERASERG